LLLRRSRPSLSAFAGCTVLLASICFKAQGQDAKVTGAPQQFPDLFGTWLENQSLIECESATRCDGVWQFQTSVGGKASWILRSITADLKVAKITGDTLEVWSVSDFSEAINAHYVGKMTNGVIEGQATWVKRDTGQHWQGPWYASLSAAALQARLGIKVTAQKPPPHTAEAVMTPAEEAAGGSRYPRQRMRFCNGAGCQTLTWADGIYEGRTTDDGAVTTNYVVNRWEPGGVELIGVALNPDGNGNFITGVATGKISSNLTEIEDAKEVWRIGTATGTIPFSLKWNAKAPPVPLPAPLPAQLPQEIKLCVDQCFRLKFNGKGYDSFSTGEEHPRKVASVTVAKFAPNSVFMQMTDTNGSKALLLGTISENAITGGKLIWLNANNGALGIFKASWGGQVDSDFKTSESLQPLPCKIPAGIPVKVNPEAMQALLVRRVAVIYPNTMFRQARMAGKIYLNATISPCGSVTSATLAEDRPQVNAAVFSQSAIVAAKKWLYKPNIVNGHAVSARTEIVVTVSLDEPDEAVTYPNGPAPQ
jgi:hypothetical protein